MFHVWHGSIVLRTGINVCDFIFLQRATYQIPQPWTPDLSRRESKSFTNPVMRSILEDVQLNCISSLGSITMNLLSQFSCSLNPHGIRDLQSKSGPKDHQGSNPSQHESTKIPHLVHTHHRNPSHAQNPTNRT